MRRKYVRKRKQTQCEMKEVLQGMGKLRGVCVCDIPSNSQERVVVFYAAEGSRWHPVVLAGSGSSDSEDLHSLHMFYDHDGETLNSYLLSL